jgi:hypothetical protein
MSFNKIKCDMIDETASPDQYNPYSDISILPSDEVNIVGQRSVDGKIYQVFAKDDELETDEFYVYGTLFGVGIAAVGYGYGYNDQDELVYENLIKYAD